MHPILSVVLLLLLSSSSVYGFAPSHRSYRPSSRLSLIEGAWMMDASAVESFFQTQPYMAAFLTCSFKASAADLLAQSRQANKDTDLQRNIGFLLYGGLYQGMCQQFIYSNIYPLFAGHEVSLESLCVRVGLDCAVFGPFLCLPLAYLVQGVMAGQAAFDGLETFKDHVQRQGLLVKYWSLWGPVQFLTFGVIPEHFQISFVAFVSFFWVCVLSSLNNDTEETLVERPRPSLKWGRQLKSQPVRNY